MRRTMRRAAVASVSLHALALAVLLWWLTPQLPLSEAPDTPVMVELVLRAEQGTRTPSAPLAGQGRESPAKPPAPAAQDQQAIEQNASEEAAPSASAPLPASPQPGSPAPPNPEAVSEQPSGPAPPSTELNLGGTGDLTNAIAEGPSVLPAKPDSRYRNREPVYPFDSALRREQGTVMLVIHVSPLGEVMAVVVTQSSGFPRLDQSARDAVETWHFLPAVKDGAPIAADMALRVMFHLH